jgi:hypothetical protein
VPEGKREREREGRQGEGRGGGRKALLVVAGGTGVTEWLSTLVRVSMHIYIYFIYFIYSFIYLCFFIP